MLKVEIKNKKTSWDEDNYTWNKLKKKLWNPIPKEPNAKN